MVKNLDFNSQNERCLQDYHIHSNFSDGESRIASIIKACYESECFEMAICDHLDESGEFMYNVHNESKSFSNYLQTIKSLKKWALSEYGVKLHASIEISHASKHFSFMFKEYILPFIKYLDMIHVDGWYVDNPINIIIKIKNILEMEGLHDFPLILAHPDFTQINKKNAILIYQGYPLARMHMH
ncbi:MAG: PHP domain-containing protein [Promethearchaeota archaeon]